MPHQLAFTEDDDYDFGTADLTCWLNDPVGYPSGCTPELLSAVAEVLVDDVPVKFFPPSLEELHFDPNRNPALEELAWGYFRYEPTEIEEISKRRIFRHPRSGRPMCIWTRSTAVDSPSCQWFVAADGSACYYPADHTAACAPACVIV